MKWQVGSTRIYQILYKQRSRKQRISNQGSSPNRTSMKEECMRSTILKSRTAKKKFKSMRLMSRTQITKVRTMTWIINKIGWRQILTHTQICHIMLTHNIGTTIRTQHTNITVQNAKILTATRQTPRTNCFCNPTWPGKQRAAIQNTRSLVTPSPVSRQDSTRKSPSNRGICKIIQQISPQEGRS